MPINVSIYTVPEVAARYQIDPDSVRDLIHGGELQAFNVGKGKKRPSYRITAEALAAFESRRAIRKPDVPVRRATKNPPAFRRFV